MFVYLFQIYCLNLVPHVQSASVIQLRLYLLTYLNGHTNEDQFFRNVSTEIEVSKYQKLRHSENIRSLTFSMANTNLYWYLFLWLFSVFYAPLLKNH